MTVGSIQQKTRKRKNVVKFGLRDEEYLREKTAKYLPFERTSSFCSSHEPPLISKVQKPMGFLNNTHIQLHPREKHTNTHKTPDPLLYLKGVHGPLQAGSIHPACICLIRAISMGETRRGNLSNPAVRTHRHMEGRQIQASHRSRHLCGLVKLRFITIVGIMAHAHFTVNILSQLCLM